MNIGRRVTQWSRIAAAGAMATAMLFSVAACSSYTPRAHQEPAPSAGETASAAAPGTESPAPAPGISVEEAQALLAAVDCTAGIDPGDINWRNTLPIFAGSGIAAAAYCAGDLLAVTMYDGDLAELASLLARPDDSTPLAEGAGCDGYYDVQPNLWVVTSEGALMQPRWPLDSCAHLLQPVPPQIAAAYGIPEEAPVVPEEQPVYEQEYVEEPVYDVPVEEPAH